MWTCEHACEHVNRYVNVWTFCLMNTFMFLCCWASKGPWRSLELVQTLAKISFYEMDINGLQLSFWVTCFESCCDLGNCALIASQGLYVNQRRDELLACQPCFLACWIKGSQTKNLAARKWCVLCFDGSWSYQLRRLLPELGVFEPDRGKGKIWSGSWFKFILCLRHQSKTKDESTT